MSETAPGVTLSLSVTDYQLVMQILQQALAPYQRLALVMQELQRQAMTQPSERNDAA